MSIRMMLDVEDLKKRVAAIEAGAVAKVESTVTETVTVAKADWEKLVARVEAVEAKVIKPKKAAS